MILAGFSLQNKLGKVRFLEVTYLLADISIEIVFEISSFLFFNANKGFIERSLF